MSSGGSVFWDREVVSSEGDSPISILKLPYDLGEGGVKMHNQQTILTFNGFITPTKELLSASV